MKINMSVLCILLLFQFACKQSEKDEWTVTHRIQYDVTIKSPDSGFDWWVQNIEGMNRESFVSSLLEAAYKGEVKTHDAFNYTAVDPAQVRNIGRRTDTLRIQHPEPPYTYYDTVIVRELSIHDVTRIRFLEEWQMNKKSMQISKEVLGIAPLLESYDEEGRLRGYQPMFWFFFNKDYPEALMGKVL